MNIVFAVRLGMVMTVVAIILLYCVWKMKG